ncbi:MAG TPA: hypothetical protein VFX96_04225 [Pyrinomonadaceae bacterium]|nr:hypothetical protein [Pyrinomonadaceae bacterium]
MHTSVHTSLLALALAAGSLAYATTDARAPRRASVAKQTRTTAPTTNAAAVFAPLPASDAVALVELRRLLNDAVPRALASDQKRLGEVNADVETFRARTGINAREFETLAVGSRVVKLASGATKLDHNVAVGRGRFDINAIVAAGRTSSKNRHTQQTHAGKTVHVFRLDEELKLFGLLKMRVGELAVCALDAQTLAVGEPEAVRAAVDAAGGRGALSPTDLAVLTQPRTPETLVTFGGRVAPELTAGIDLGNAEITRSVASVREMFGAVRMVAAGFDVQTTLRTSNESEARELGGVLATLKQAAPFLLSQVEGERGRVARNAAERLQVATQGTDVQLRLEVPQADITTLVGVL